MKIAQHSAVTVHYRLTDADGQIIEDSFDADPMVYLHGTNSMIPGLEAALEGKEVGNKIDATIAAKDGYGEFVEELRQEVPIDAFGDIEDIVPGMRFMAETDDGEIPVQITEVKDDTVIVDGNHPLAGKELSFHVEVIEVRAATENEIAHGHVHAADSSCEDE
ncbi:MAG: peptidylprolyl isomerase [Shewanella sp.]|nr:peptidylprolyl isomerase [Shewanella sp.]